MINTKKKIIKRYAYKKCSCPKDFWEIIIVDDDENFNNKTTIYYHCDLCGIDWLITDYYNESKKYYSHKL